MCLGYELFFLLQNKNLSFHLSRIPQTRPESLHCISLSSLLLIFACFAQAVFLLFPLDRKLSAKWTFQSWKTTYVDTLVWELWINWRHYRIINYRLHNHSKSLNWCVSSASFSQRHLSCRVAAMNLSLDYLLSPRKAWPEHKHSTWMINWRKSELGSLLNRIACRLFCITFSLPVASMDGIHLFREKFLFTYARTRKEDYMILWIISALNYEVVFRAQKSGNCHSTESALASSQF